MMSIASNPAVKNGLKVAAGLTGIAVGVTTMINQASAKYPTGGQPLWPNKTAYLVARMVGPDIANNLFKQVGFSGIQTPQGINPLGVLNEFTFGGIVLLAVDGVVHAFIGGKYGYSYARPFIHSIAAGLIGGGIVGGIFDPPGEASTSTEPGLSRNPILPLTAPSAYANDLMVTA